MKQPAHAINGMIENYVSWLRERLKVQDLGTWFEITTPYLDRHNDCIQIYARQDETGTWTLSDGSTTIRDLEMSGVSLDTEKRKSILKETLNGFGVKLVNSDEIQTTATENNFPQRKHHLIQAMLTVGDMFQLSSPYVQSIFLEEVARWLTAHDVRANRSVNIVGKTGLDHRIDFMIPASRQSPERLVNIISTPKKQQAELIAFRWIDVRESREGAQFYALINDTTIETVPRDVIDVLTAYQVHAVPWRQREKVLPALAA